MAAPTARAATTYRNPLPIAVPGGPPAETWADPASVRGDDGAWYAYGTSDPLGGADRDASGALRVHGIPMAGSADLVHWTYAGDALTAAPAWAAPDAGLWAPEVRRVGGRWVMYSRSRWTCPQRAGSTSNRPASCCTATTTPT